MRGRPVKRGLGVASVATQGEAPLRVPNGGFAQTGPGICGGQQTLGSQVVQKTACFEPMKAGSVGGVDHAFGILCRPLLRLRQAPGNILFSSTANHR